MADDLRDETIRALCRALWIKRSDDGTYWTDDWGFEVELTDEQRQLLDALKVDNNK